jgi:class 3 adenylate cyclase
MCRLLPPSRVFGRLILFDRRGTGASDEVSLETQVPCPHWSFIARNRLSSSRRLVKLTGDGVLATFDGPGRAIRCAFALRDALDPLGLNIRAGLPTGEVELRGADIGGIGVHVAARVLEQAGPGELVSQRRFRCSSPVLGSSLRTVASTS